MRSLRLPRALVAPAVLVVGALVLAACSSSTPASDSAASASAPAATDLAGTAWVLESYAAADGTTTPAATQKSATLRFAADGTFSGSTGCNNLAGTYTQDGAALTITPGPMTMMACQEPAARQETDVIAALAKVATFTAADTLVLQDAQGAALLTYAPGLTSLAGTSWQATGINNGSQAVVSEAGTEKATIAFGSDGTATGSGGCNTFTGPFTTSGADQIAIGPLASTAMACEEPASTIEQNYFTALANATTYQIDGSTLTLRDASGAMQVTFTQA